MSGATEAIYKLREYSKRTGETGLIKSAQGALGYKFTGGGGKRKKPSMQSLPAPKAIPPTTKQQQAGYSSIYGTSEIAPTYKISTPESRYTPNLRFGTEFASTNGIYHPKYAIETTNIGLISTPSNQYTIITQEKKKTGWFNLTQEIGEHFERKANLLAPKIEQKASNITSILLQSPISEQRRTGQLAKETAGYLGLKAERQIFRFGETAYKHPILTAAFIALPIGKFAGKGLSFMTKSKLSTLAGEKIANIGLLGLYVGSQRKGERLEALGTIGLAGLAIKGAGKGFEIFHKELTKPRYKFTQFAPETIVTTKNKGLSFRTISEGKNIYRNILGEEFSLSFDIGRKATSTEIGKNAYRYKSTAILKPRSITDYKGQKISINMGKFKYNTQAEIYNNIIAGGTTTITKGNKLIDAYYFGGTKESFGKTLNLQLITRNLQGQKLSQLSILTKEKPFIKGWKSDISIANTKIYETPEQNILYKFYPEKLIRSKKALGYGSILKQELKSELIPEIYNEGFKSIIRTEYPKVEIIRKSINISKTKWGIINISGTQTKQSKGLFQFKFQQPILSQTPISDNILKQENIIKQETIKTLGNEMITRQKLGFITPKFDIGTNIPEPPIYPKPSYALPFGGGGSFDFWGRPRRKTKFKSKYFKSIEGIIYGGKKTKQKLFTGLEVRA